MSSASGRPEIAKTCQFWVVFGKKFFGVQFWTCWIKCSVLLWGMSYWPFLLLDPENRTKVDLPSSTHCVNGWFRFSRKLLKKQHTNLHRWSPARSLHPHRKLRDQLLPVGCKSGWLPPTTSPSHLENKNKMFFPQQFPNLLAWLRSYCCRCRV